MANTLETLTDILSILAARGVRCDIFGGWAEEILKLRSPWKHSDIDLLYRAEDFLLLDAAVADLQGIVSGVPQKRFHHKRAFIFRQTLCEAVLINDDGLKPVTNYWGDAAFYWEKPLLHPEAVSLCDGRFTVVSAQNLRKHRDEKRSRQPNRWRETTSFGIP